MTLAQDITRHFDGDWHGDYGAFPAPGHSKDDRGVTVKDTQGGDVVFNSFNGADWRELKDECRRIGLLPERPARSRSDEAPRETGHYDYVDGDGAVVYRTVRIEQAGRRKRFMAQRPDGRGGWIDGIGDVPRVLYRLPDIKAAIVKAVRRDTDMPTIYLIEGERKADKLAGWGLLATAVAFGCKGWRRDYAEDLAGCTVIILPDNDDEGRHFAARAGRDIEAARGKVRIIDLPGLPPKGDIMDWGGTADDLRALVEQSVNPPVKLLPLLDPAAWEGQETPAREWAWAGYIPHRQATYLTGPGSAGKSLLTQQLCTAIAMAMQFMGMDTREAVALYVTCEDDADELHRRQKAICAAMGVPLPALSGKLHLVSLAGATGNELVTFTPEGRMVIGEAYRTILATAKAVGARFVALDNVAHLFAGNENIRNQVAAFVSLLNNLAAEIDGSVLFLGHPNKAGQDFSGSTAWENQVRSRLFMEVPKGEDGGILDPDARVLTRGKANYARNGERLAFRWHEWAFVRDEDLPPNVGEQLRETIMANADNAAFLRCLDERNRQRRHVSEKPTASNYAPRQFEGMPEAKGAGKKRLEAAMDRLFRIKAIERGFLWRDTAEGKDIHGLRKVGEFPESSPEGSRNPFPEGSGDPQETTGNSVPISKDIEVAAHEAAAPSREEDDGPADGDAFAADPDDVGDPNIWPTGRTVF